MPSLVGQYSSGSNPPLMKYNSSGKDEDSRGEMKGACATQPASKAARSTLIMKRPGNGAPFESDGLHATRQDKVEVQRELLLD